MAAEALFAPGSLLGRIGARTAAEVAPVAVEPAR